MKTEVYEYSPVIVLQDIFCQNELFSCARSNPQVCRLRGAIVRFYSNSTLHCPSPHHPSCSLFFVIHYGVRRTYLYFWWVGVITVGVRARVATRLFLAPAELLFYLQYCLGLSVHGIIASSVLRSQFLRPPPLPNKGQCKNTRERHFSERSVPQGVATNNDQFYWPMVQPISYYIITKTSVHT